MGQFLELTLCTSNNCKNNLLFVFHPEQDTLLDQPKCRREVSTFYTYKFRGDTDTTGFWSNSEVHSLRLVLLKWKYTLTTHKHSQKHTKSQSWSQD